MKSFLTLLHREWLQHRFGWTVLALAPLGLAVLLLSFGQIQIEDDAARRMGEAFPAMLAMASIAGSTALTFAVLWVTSMIMVGGLAHRDHNDCSVEFWLSLPTGHAPSLAAPLLMLLLVVPAAALVIGVLGGYVVSLVVVTRLAGFGAWLSLPWLDIMVGSFAGLLRVLAGLPLATLWLLPLTMALVLFGAWFKRWGLPILAAALGVGGLVLNHVFGQPMIFDVIRNLSRHAGQALLITGEGGGMVVESGSDMMAAVRAIPAFALSDYGHALAALASPLFAGALLVSAAGFALLVDWRRRGA